MKFAPSKISYEKGIGFEQEDKCRLTFGTVEEAEGFANAVVTEMLDLGLENEGYSTNLKDSDVTVSKGLYDLIREELVMLPSVRLQSLMSDSLSLSGDESDNDRGIPTVVAVNSRSKLLPDRDGIRLIVPKGGQIRQSSESSTMMSSLYPYGQSISEVDRKDRGRYTSRRSYLESESSFSDDEYGIPGPDMTNITSRSYPLSDYFTFNIAVGELCYAIERYNEANFKEIEQTVVMDTFWQAIRSEELDLDSVSRHLHDMERELAPYEDQRINRALGMIDAAVTDFYRKQVEAVPDVDTGPYALLSASAAASIKMPSNPKPAVKRLLPPPRFSSSEGDELVFPNGVSLSDLMYTDRDATIVPQKAPQGLGSELRGTSSRFAPPPPFSSMDDDNLGFGGMMAPQSKAPQGLGSELRGTSSRFVGAPPPPFSSMDDDDFGFGGMMAPQGLGSELKGTSSRFASAPPPPPLRSTNGSSMDGDNLGFGGMMAPQSKVPQGLGSELKGTSSRFASAPPPPLRSTNGSSMDGDNWGFGGMMAPQSKAPQGLGSELKGTSLRSSDRSLSGLSAHSHSTSDDELEFKGMVDQLPKGVSSQLGSMRVPSPGSEDSYKETLQLSHVSRLAATGYKGGPSSSNTSHVAAAKQSSGYALAETVNAMKRVTGKSGETIRSALLGVVERSNASTFTTRDITNGLKALGVQNPTGSAIQTVGEINKARGQGAGMKL